MYQGDNPWSDCSDCSEVLFERTVSPMTMNVEAEDRV